MIRFILWTYRIITSQTILSSGFGNPFNLAIDSQQNVYVTDISTNQIIKVLNNGTAIALVSGSAGCWTGSMPGGIVLDSNGNIFMATQSDSKIYKITPSLVCSFTNSYSSWPTSMSIDNNNMIYIAETGNTNFRIWNPLNSQSRSVGNFPANSPQGVTISSQGFLYGSDLTNNIIKKYNATSGNFISNIGSGFSGPHQLTTDCAGNIYIADTYRNAIKVIIPDGSVKNVGWGYQSPTGVQVDKYGVVYIADSGNKQIKIMMTTVPCSCCLTTGNNIFLTKFIKKGNRLPIINNNVQTNSNSTFSPPPIVNNVFVTRVGNQIMLNGSPFSLVGANLYYLAGYYGHVAPVACSVTSFPQADYDSYLQAYFQAVKSNGWNIVRFWAFQSVAGINGTDYYGIERVIQHARNNSIRLMLTLENNWQDCTYPVGVTKDANWYTSGYLSPYGGYTLSFKEYVRNIVTTYANEPTIAVWGIMNEAKGYFTNGGNNPNAIITMLNDIGGLIKSIDSNHLVSSGGTLECWDTVNGAKNFQMYGEVSSIDILDFHDYSDTAWMSCIDLAVKAAKAVCKPLFIAEYNIVTSMTPLQRSTILQQKIIKQAQNFVQASLIWSFLYEASGSVGYLDLVANDPALPYLTSTSYMSNIQNSQTNFSCQWNTTTKSLSKSLSTTSSLQTNSIRTTTTISSLITNTLRSTSTNLLITTSPINSVTTTTNITDSLRSISTLITTKTNIITNTLNQTTLLTTTNLLIMIFGVIILTILTGITLSCSKKRDLKTTKQLNSINLV